MAERPVNFLLVTQGDDDSSVVDLQREASFVKAAAASEAYTRPLPNCSFHLEFNQSVQLRCVFHWKFFHDRLNETVDDQRHRLIFGQSAAPQIVELFVSDLCNHRFVGN